MNRRSVLAAGVAAAFGGGLGYRVLQTPPTPGPVTGIDFVARETDPSDQSEEPPRIDETDEHEFFVTGEFIVGNSCNAAMLDTVEYDESADELIIEVVGEDDSWPWEFRCTDIEQYNEYELTVDVESLPARITVIERGSFDDTHTSKEL
ncbi:uncharacterized protein Nmag_4161 (plasmid) [Natrialba magadii ATCC 43099]|uniref:Uncharacterized protein n=1 Tax=Natrialba magadii (strain ATCC 43099 / DSM 3394 / CCM 3739 / CIP 104546 / IAM 13178 / JCM 8861 / NBRC 102185 / NCIMB 2190 / MS3) TaxID=547559 RepID=D3T267_NATMM|nr:hypothetical protein [Natrialba magadii]ADD07676.1 uncharacterized protein Nmag_4161 [Natrialba magadii ATCC 43099]ELY26484.1 hypothetical protein C500_15015 [Natrialba magadii ATCC 43099]